MRLTFGKKQRLKRRNLIDDVFVNGSKLKGFPLIGVVYPCALPEAVPIQVATQVSKRRFRRAVDRNRIKRLMREAWRRHKGDLEKQLSEADIQYAAVFIFVGKEMPTLKELDRSVVKIIGKWEAQLTLPEEGRTSKP